MARRRNSVYQRFAKLRGLPSDERALLLRLGNLMDAALNNRQASNPFENSRNAPNPRVYPPTGLLARTGIQNVTLIWDPPDEIQLLRYEIVFKNLTTGTTVTLSSFTTTITYAAPAGEYVATVKAVGRDSTSSILKEVTFSVNDEIMQIEGAKNGPTELGTLVQDNIKLLAGQSVYVWGSLVLSKYIAGSLIGNRISVLRLWQADGADALFENATLLETIQLYAATESCSSLDDTARGGVIIRPIGSARIAQYETSQAVMFSPIEVADEDDEKTVTFFLQAINREIEQDEVCLSLVMWTGDNGPGGAIPGDEYSPPPDDVFPHKNSFHTQSVGWKPVSLDVRSLWAEMPNGMSMIGNKWSVGFWVRFDDLAGGNIGPAAAEGSNPNGGGINLFRRASMTSFQDDLLNSIWFFIRAFPDGFGGWVHRLQIQVNSYYSGGPEGIAVYDSVCYGPREEQSEIMVNGDAASTHMSDPGWYFFTICFSGGEFAGGVPKVRLFRNSELILPVGDTTVSNFVIQDDSQHLAYALGDQGAEGVGGSSVQNFVDGVYAGDVRNPFVNNLQYHQLGIWNNCLDLGIIPPWEGNMLWMHSYGINADWKGPGIYDFKGIDQGKNYKPETLVHINKFGAIEQPMESLYPGRDTGTFMWKGDLNWTHVTEPYIAGTGNSWTDNTTIADVLSPAGLNGTTKFGYAYPGQNGVTED